MNYNKNNNDNNPWGSGGNNPWGSGGSSNNMDFEDSIKKAKEKYELQINSDVLTFNTPIPKEENCFDN